MHVTVYPLTAADVDNAKGSVVGHPLDDLQSYLLDTHRQLVPIGVLGEIYVGGNGVARGYLNRPALTAERFLPHPYSDEPGARLYKTGDMARYRPDGDLEYLGRLDHQVQIRGFRIELGEIEAVLTQHPAVRYALVVVQEEAPGDTRLIAYIVPAQGETLTTSALQAFTRTQLPAYMVPATFVFLDDLPLTPSGKIDRRALPEPEAVRPALDTVFVAPRNTAEERLTDLWAELLGIEQVGIHDNFFELGGHSLLATQLISRMREAFQVEIPLQSLFEGPTVEQLAKNIGTAIHAATQVQTPWLQPASRDEALPLSYTQQRLWFLDQLEPGVSPYKISGAACLRGRLSLKVLDQVLNALVQRHEVLRTTFPMEQGRPIQHIAPTHRLTLSLIDLQPLTSRARAAVVQHLSEVEAHRPFALDQGPLMRAVIFRLGADEHILLLTWHHIIFDGWSLGIFLKEFAALYTSFNAGQLANLPELPIQYADFAVWQRQHLQGAWVEEHLAYWQQQLADAPPLLFLPTDWPRPPRQTFRGAEQIRTLSPSLTEALKVLSQQAGSTLFMTLLAAFKILLHRLTGQDDIIIGSPIANRTHTEIESLIGCFLNNLVLRTDLSGNPAFRELLARVRAVCLGAYAHQELPFEYLLEALQPERDTSYTPLFQVLFNMLEPMDAVTLSDLTMEILKPVTPEAKFDLTLYVTEQADGLQLQLVYNVDLFSEPRMQVLLQQFHHLLVQIAAEPTALIGSYTLVTPEALSVLPDPRAPLPEPHYEPIPTLIDTWASRLPEHPALCQGEVIWSYATLVRRAQHLARLLLAQGLVKGEVVAVCGERSLGVITSMLGVLLSGGVLLPIDPRLPLGRQHLMLQEAKAKWLVNVGEVQAIAKGSDDLEVLSVSPDTAQADMSGVEPLADHGLSVLCGEDAAYIFFTSGTTGIPKAVLGTHKGLSHLLTWQRETFEIGAADRCAQLTGLSFDVVLRDVFLPLVSGATLCLPQTDLAPEAVLAWLGRHEISVLHTVPALAQAWLAMAPSEIDLPALRWVFLAGEALPEDLVHRWRQAVGRSAHMVNLYGPTETTLAKCCYVVPAEPPAGIQPVGQPLPATQALVLSDTDALCGIGEPGEIVLRTPFRTRGYLNAAAEQARQFVANPFTSDADDVVYRTGDRGRYGPDGTLDILGRFDDQVKIRGIRVEPEEVTAHVVQHALVDTAVVVARRDDRGETALVAYVVAAGGQEVTLSMLHEHLRHHLASAWLPSACVGLEELPLTPNGKVDRQALPEPLWSQPTRDAVYVAPRTPLEEVLAELWAEVLGVDAVGMNDDFFALGGHSLLAIQIIARMGERLQVKLSVQQLFETPTLAELARHVASQLTSGEVSQLPLLVPMPRHGSIPLSFSQQRFWLLAQLNPGVPLTNISGALHMRGPFSVTIMAQVFRALVQRHEILRTTFPVHNGQPVQVIGAPEISLQVVDLRNLPSSIHTRVVSQLAAAEARRPFDLAQGPLIRATLLRLATDVHVLLRTVHHLLTDGWSNRIFRREASTLYQAFSTGQPSPLPDLPVQYADFALWQQQCFKDEVIELQLAYWQQQLAGAPSVLNLPTDYPRPAIQRHREAWHRQTLSAELTGAIKRLAQQHDSTLFMTLLAAYGVLLYRHTGQDDLVVGTPINSRPRRELESLIGYFLNPLPLRLDLSGAPTCSELLRRTRQVCLEAYAHQEVPFEQVLTSLRVERHLSHAPLFQVFLNMLEFPEPATMELPGLTLESLGGELPAALFDLTLYVRDQPEGLELLLMYDADLFDGATTQRLLDHFSTLLEGFVADPSVRLSSVTLLSDAERQELLTTWNATQVTYPLEACVHHLVALQARQSPNAVALLDGETQLTYRALEAWSTHVAHHLRARGVGPEVRVGIYLERSVSLLVGVLGVLKAGGAYLPLDQTYPASRLEFMLDDAAVPVLLTQRSLLTDLPASKAEVICLDGLPGPSEQVAAMPLHSGVTADHLAYVIYTSGSTGQPKGVQISHRAAVNFLYTMRDLLNVTARDTLVAITTLSFDIALMELILPLTVGARVVVANREQAMDGVQLMEQLTTTGATALQATPATWRLLLAAGWTGQPQMRLWCGGEALPRDLADQLHDKGAALWNLYGPTETTVWSTADAVAPGVGPVSIGRPIGNTQVYVLDAEMQPVPVGAPGDLYIGGAGLSRGYLGRPGLTAERFIPDPFGEGVGGRLYQTGDRARYRSDGRLEYLGRLDHQMKLRGFRVELGEIESVLNQHESVRESVVVAREVGPDDIRLVAYVVGHLGAASAAPSTNGDVTNESMTVAKSARVVLASAFTGFPTRVHHPIDFCVP